MPTVEELKNDLLAWAIAHGVLSDDAMRNVGVTNGDPNSLPFDGSHAEFFRARKIVKITTTRKGRNQVVSLFSRLPIARAKIDKLQKVFNRRFNQEGFLLSVGVEKSFKIDQNIIDTINPVYFYRKRFTCGSSIGLGNQRNAGTLTALGRGPEGSLVGISCNHVTGGCNTARPGTPIVVPGIQDVSPENHEIAVIGVHDFTGPMSQGLPQVFNISTNSDIAFFQINDDQAQLLSSMQGEGADAYDTPTQFARVTEGTNVKKWGRTTGRTRGSVKRVIQDAEAVPYKVTSYFGPTSSQTFNGTVFFRNFYEVQSHGVDPFSAGGDSGSLVVTDHDGKEKIVGILIGGDTKRSFILPLKQILKSRKVTPINGHNI